MNIRSATIAVGIAAAVLALSARGSGHPATHSPGTATTSTSAFATSTTVTTPSAATVPVTGAAGTEFGSRESTGGVEAAYHAVQTAKGLTAALAPGVKTSRTYEPVRALMTAAAWSSFARQADAGDPHNIAWWFVLSSTSAGDITVEEAGTVLHTPAQPRLAGQQQPSEPALTGTSPTCAPPPGGACPLFDQPI